MRTSRSATAGHVYYLNDGGRARPSLQRYDLDKRKNETVLADAADYVVSADGKKILYRAGTNWSIVGARRRRSSASEGRIAADAVEVKIDPRAEWTQIFDEAWRINRDYFYAPNMHGADWNGDARQVRGAPPARRDARAT